MARQVIETLIDDLDGTEAAETVSFGLDGTSYEIDLNKRNAAALRKALDRYIRAAQADSTGPRTRRRPKSQPSKRAKSKSNRDYDIAQLREWAGANKVSVPSRGRIPQAVVEQYKAAGGR